MKNLITKSDFVRYKVCPLYAWLWKNRPDLREGHKNSRLADQGYEVEKLAGEYLKSLFPGKVELQMEDETDKYYARADIIVKNSGGWDLYEVKSSSRKKKEHVDDICFQVEAFRKAGNQINQINLVHLNKDYRFDIEKGLELDDFFTIEPITDEINEGIDKRRLEMEEAYKVLTGPKEPSVEIRKKNFEYELPPKFAEYYHANRKEFDIYDISNIRANNLKKLIGMNIEMIKDIPDGFFDNTNYDNQVVLVKEKKVFQDKPAIKKKLDELEYPLYFLDYETINPAIPFLDKKWPHQQVVFQYSLHIIDKLGAKPSHVDYLHTEKTDPVPYVLKSMMENIGNTGSVVVWHAGFESLRNKVIADSYPEYKEFMESVNNRMFDLELIYKKEYLDYRFKGRSSIKVVLPIIVPDLNYDDLEVQHGAMAMDRILDLVEEDCKNKKELETNLKKYCQRDTWAMVRIYQELLKLI